MHKLIVSVFVLFLIVLAKSAIYAQDEVEICSPIDISTRADEAINQYQTMRLTANDMDSSLSALDKLQSKLGNIQNRCANIASNSAEAHGTGTLQDPYLFGSAGDLGGGMSVQLTGYIRPADQMIQNENMFNDSPKNGETYVIVQVTVQCDRNSNGRCETNYLDYELTGDLGTIYDVASVVYGSELDAKLLAGGIAVGGLPFLVRQDDTNLKLLYRPNMFEDEFVAFEAMPSQSSGVEITTSTGLNVRTGPGTTFGLAGNLSANEPVIAFGRNADGTWLQVPMGWVFAELVTANGDIQQLPITSQ